MKKPKVINLKFKIKKMNLKLNKKNKLPKKMINLTNQKYYKSMKIYYYKVYHQMIQKVIQMII